MKGINQPSICRFVRAVIGVYVAAHVAAQPSPNQDFEAAKREYEQSARDETARVTYVRKLAQITDR